MTGQERFDRYVDAGAYVSIDLVNHRRPRSDDTSAAMSSAWLREVLAVDPPSVARLRGRHVAGFATLAGHLDGVFAAVAHGELDAAAGQLNTLLSAHPAHPHLAKDNGRWRLHHHPASADLVGMWTSICAENLARVIAADDAQRLGTCEATGCRRVFLDESKNASRRHCSTACTNRMRSAAYRNRHKK